MTAALAPAALRDRARLIAHDSGGVLSIAAFFVVMTVAFSLITETFLTEANLLNILRQIAPLMIVAVAMTFLVLLGVIAHNLRLRTREIEIEKLLGADATLIRRLITTEYLVLATVASVFGAGFSIVMTLIVTIRILDLKPQIDLGAFVISVGGTILVTGVIANLSARRVLGLRGTSSKF